MIYNFYKSNFFMLTEKQIKQIKLNVVKTFLKLCSYFCSLIVINYITLMLRNVQYYKNLTQNIQMTQSY